MPEISRKNKDILRFAGLLVVVIAVNWLASSVVSRWDLTSDNRYTLADITREFLSDIDEPVFAHVYLSGDLNVGFERLSRATREKLEEFGIYAGNDLDYRFVDPTGNDDEAKRAKEKLNELGLDPVPVFEAEDDGSRKKTMVYPYLIFQHGDNEIAVDLLKNMQGRSGAENLNASLEGLEYKLTDALRRLLLDQMQKIAFLEGHGELGELDVIDITDELSKYYQVDRGNPGNNPGMLEPYEALIIAGPTERFSEPEKYSIDQYIMNGGRVLWLVDGMEVSMDSLRIQSNTVGVPLDVNLNDQLFRYGFRINPVLVQDVQSGVVPVNVSAPGESSQFVPMPWPFRPLLNTNMRHPVTRNVSVVRGQFVSSVDTVGDDMNTTVTPLLQTSRHSREMQSPVYINMAQVREEPRRENFPQSNIPVAYAAEGEFPSVFQNRSVPPEISQSGKEKKSVSDPTRMIVVGDGDIIKNEVKRRDSNNPRILPLGFEEPTNRTYGNKQFVLNAVNYLTDDEGWMQLRTRNYQLRLLNRDKIANEGDFWKMFNLGLPLLFVLLAGFAVPFIRKQRFGK
ncbi:MAG: gliding motility-associated ABC transporter substrate-binding protein GldG [Marinilabiliaceae bacterium]